MQVQYFICHKEETLLRSKANNIFNALSALNLTCRKEKSS